MKKPFKVYLIDDDSIEVLKLERVIKTLELDCDLIHFSNGEDAIDQLKNAANTPRIILLDLNMAKFSGLDFLKFAKQDSSLKNTPIIVLTTSNNQKDVGECYAHGAAGYFVKPLKYEDYLDRISVIFQYWSVNEFA